jgi:UDP-2-acetamido-3-amino-2,3-dideoxy-glucuronate N-acetyltransferase
VLEKRVDYRIDETAFIHGKASVDETVTVGARSRVWQFASIVREAAVGEDCSIASCAIVDGATIGDRSIISHSAFIDPGISIGEDVFIGPNVSLCNDAWPRADKTGFDMALFLSGEFITTKIEDGASLGANVVVLPGVTVGKGAMVAAGAVVTQSVPACHLFKRSGEMVPIDPAKPVKRMRRA